jgi:hypothetical protein
MKNPRDLFGMFAPMTVCFNDDGGAGDANNSDANGGADDDKSGGGAGSGDDKASKAQTFELDVAGEKRTVTLDEMKVLATKSAGADAKFQDAADMRKEAENGIRIEKLVKSLESDGGTDQEAKELAILLGIDPGDLMEYLHDGGEQSTNTNDNGNQSPAKLTPEQVAEVLGFNPAEAKQILQHSQNRHIASARKELRELSDAAVDKDEVFGKMIVGDKKDDRMSVIKDMVAEDILGKIERGNPYGAEMVAASIQKIRAQFTKFGIPSASVVNPVVLGLGPGAVLPSEVQSEEPIKRVNAFEAGAEDNLVKRYLQKAVKAARNLGQG